MSTITLGSTAQQQFVGIQDPSMVMDANGQLLGTFFPAKVSPYPCPISEEELDRRAAEPTGRTTQEILTELKAKYPI